MKTATTFAGTFEQELSLDIIDKDGLPTSLRIEAEKLISDYQINGNCRANDWIMGEDISIELKRAFIYLATGIVPEW